MAITGSGGSAGAFADAAHTRAADTRSRRTEIQARRGETQTGGRTIFLPPKPSSRILAKTLSSAGRPLIGVHLRPPELHKSTSSNTDTGTRKRYKGRHAGGLTKFSSRLGIVCCIWRSGSVTREAIAEPGWKAPRFGYSVNLDAFQRWAF